MTGAEAPKRVQQKRTKGWRKPENTVSVARPSKWGNPYVFVRISDQEWAVGYQHPSMGTIFAGAEGSEREARDRVVSVYRDLMIARGADVAELKGKNLMCFCPLSQPCHADVLLELANQEEVAVD